MLDDMINGAAFGMIKSGKTTLARKIAWHFWKTKGIRSIYFDPKCDPVGNWWPESGTVFYDPEKFWKAAWDNTNLFVVADEAAISIGRDRDLMAVFTMMNGRHHRFFCDRTFRRGFIAGHEAANRAPIPFPPSNRGGGFMAQGIRRRKTHGVHAAWTI